MGSGASNVPDHHGHGSVGDVTLDDGNRPTSSSASSFVEKRKHRFTIKPMKILPKGADPIFRLLHLTGTHQDGKRHIDRTDNFEKLYALGAEVMPATHRGMEVKHAMRLKDGERVVVKVRSKQESFIDQREQDEWCKITEIMLNLPKSGCIAQVLEVLEDSTKFYIVMEFVEGSDLYEVLDCRGRLPVTDAKDIIRKLVTAVAELHARGCIHKDLKLENVMVGQAVKRLDVGTSVCQVAAWTKDEGEPGPVVKLIDFDTVEKWAPDAHRVPQCVLGSDQYISHEAYAGNYSPASDMFAVGVIAYRLLTGTFPFNPSIFDDEAGDNYVGSPKMKEIQNRLMQFSIDWTQDPFTADEGARDFCSSLLSADCSKRPSAAESLLHTWFDAQKSRPGTAQTASPCSVSSSLPELIPN